MMFRLIKQVFIVLLSFSRSLATKCVYDNEPCMARPTLTGLNPIEPNYYPFMTQPSIHSLDKCNGSCNAVDDKSTKACASSKIKDVMLKFLI